MAIDNVFDPAIECIEPIRDDEPLLMVCILLCRFHVGERRVCDWGIGMGCR